MANRDGNADATRKVGVEEYYAYGLADIEKMGNVPVTEEGSGVYTPESGFVYDEVNGENVVVRAESAINITDALVITVYGTNPSDEAINAQVTIPAGAPEGQAYDLKNVAEDKWKSITDIAFTGGALGDGFGLYSFPDDADFTDLDFVQNAKFDVGGTVKAVPKHYEPVDHNKRIRGENTLTISELYGKNLSGLAKIKNRDVVLRVRTHTNGASVASESRYYSTCRTTVPITMPENDEFVTVEAEGRFGKEFVFG